MYRNYRIDPEIVPGRAKAMFDTVTPLTTIALLPETLACPNRSDQLTAGNVQGLTPGSSFISEQQRRLAELMSRWWQARDSGNRLPPEEQAELEAIAQAELRGPGAESV